MTQQTARRGLFPTAPAEGAFPADPAEIEHVVGLLIAEAADETFAAPSELLRTWLAAELRRAPHFDELPETFSDAAYFAPGYWRDCAELFAWLGYLGKRNPERWQSSAERERERASLLAAIKSIALHVRQYIGDVHAEDAPAVIDRGRRALAALDERREGARAAAQVRAGQLAEQGESTRAAVVRVCERLQAERRLSAGALYDQAAAELRADPDRRIVIKPETVAKYWREHLKPKRKRTHRR